MLYELPARRATDDRSDSLTSRRLEELIAVCLGSEQADAWAMSIIARPRCRILPFTRPVRDAAPAYASEPLEDDEAAR